MSAGPAQVPPLLLRSGGRESAAAQLGISLEDIDPSLVGFRRSPTAPAALPGATVRKVRLQDGALASVVIVQGKLSSILSESGHQATFAWPGAERKRNSRHDWSVKLHTPQPPSGIDKASTLRTRSGYRTQSLPKILHNLTFTSVDHPFEEAATAAAQVGARRRRSLMTAPMSPQSSPDMLMGQRSGHRHASADGGSRGFHQTRSAERMHILPASYSAGSASVPDMKAGFQPTIRQGPLGAADAGRARGAAALTASPVRGSDSMPVIMEAGSGAGQHWNPTSSWLPSEMTANGAPGRDPLPSAVNSQGTQTMPASELFERGAGPTVSREEGVNTAPQRFVAREEPQRSPPATTRYVARSQADLRAAVAREGDVRVTSRDTVLASDDTTRSGSDYSAGQTVQQQDAQKQPPGKVASAWKKLRTRMTRGPKAPSDPKQQKPKSKKQPWLLQLFRGGQKPEVVQRPARTRSFDEGMQRQQSAPTDKRAALQTAPVGPRRPMTQGAMPVSSLRNEMTGTQQRVQDLPQNRGLSPSSAAAAQRMQQEQMRSPSAGGNGLQATRTASGEPDWDARAQQIAAMRAEKRRGQSAGAEGTSMRPTDSAASSMTTPGGRAAAMAEARKLNAAGYPETYDQGRPAATRTASGRTIPPVAGSAAQRLQASLAEPAALDNRSRPASSARDSFSAAPAQGGLPAHSARDSFLVNAPAPTGNDFQQWAARKTRAMLEAAPAPDPALLPKRSGLAGRWVKNPTEGTSSSEVDSLLKISSLQRLARQRISELDIVETDSVFEMIWHIPLNNGLSRISKTERYIRNGEVVEGPRRDGRAGMLRSQLNFTAEGHVHIRALQSDPYSAVFHDRLKLSTGGHRLKIEQKFQLLSPGVMPVKHFSIWHRVEE
ncbi:hypothetical protein WJX74_006984 [Apatococcus lobatus]|uniref:Uncharacterized protein n=1 Tax=Apatococcus lobatus TaxID=904363 RepID=A0AAW1QJJ7_9CHLO